jgi:hypothetical protein
MAKKKEEEKTFVGEPPPPDEEEIRKTPAVEGDFSTLLHDYGIKEDKAAVITSYTNLT